MEAQTCAPPFFAAVPWFAPMILKLDRDVNIFKTCLQTENEVTRSSRSKVIAYISTEIALKVKGQGQMSPTSKHV